jgi:hypothetical protein
MAASDTRQIPITNMTKTTVTNIHTTCLLYPYVKQTFPHRACVGGFLFFLDFFLDGLPLWLVAPRMAFAVGVYAAFFGRVVSLHLLFLLAYLPFQPVRELLRGDFGAALAFIRTYPRHVRRVLYVKVNINGAYHVSLPLPVSG